MKFFDLFRSQAGKPSPAQRAPLAMALEPRMLFDGAVAATVADAAQPEAAQAQAGDSQANDAPDAAPPAATADQRQEIVFIDGQVQDKQQLIDGLKPGSEVVVLDDGRDGLQQIADYLEGRSGIDAIHILSHGAEGQLQLGTVTLDQASLAGRTSELAAIGRSLTADGDILLYGCDVARGGDNSFIDQLAALTGADVAASSNATGSSTLGGDWQLESHSGAIESTTLGVDSNLPEWQHLLASITTTPGGTVYAEGTDVDTYTFNGVGRDTFRLDQTGSYTFTGSINSPGDPTDVLPIEIVSGGYIDSYTLTISNQSFNLGAQLYIEDMSGTFSRSHALANLTENTDISAGYYSFYIGHGAPAGLSYSLTLNVIAPVATTAPSLTASAVNPSFSENGSAVDLFSGVTAATNDSGQTFSGMTLTVSNVSNGAAETLTIGGTSVALNSGNSGSIAGGGTYSVSVSGSLATVTLTGMTRSNASLGTLIDGISYHNSSDDPGASSRVVTITQIRDSGASNNTATPNIAATVSVTPSNDAPTLSATGSTPTFTENGSAVTLFSGTSAGTVENGQNIDRLTLTVSNLGDGSAEVLRVDGSDVALTNGNSVTTATNGMTVSVSVAGGVASVTVEKSGGVSTATLNGLVNALAYRNDSDTPSTGARVITLTGLRDTGGTANGGVDSTSLSLSASVTVAAQNDAPTLSGGPYAWTATNEDTTSAAVSVSSLLAGLSHADADGPASGIALTASSGNGTWQYSTDGLAWSAVGSVANASALLLSASTQLRFVPDGANGGTASLTFRAWDQNIGTASTNATRNTADTSSNGGSTAFSSGTALATLSVTSVNDAPTLANPIPDQNASEDSAFNFQFAASTFADLDTGDSLTYSAQLAGGGALPAWLSFDAATRTFSGTPTESDAGTLSLQVIADDGHGGTVSATFSIVVAAVNDAPLLTTTGGTTAFVEPDGAGSTPVVVDNGISLSDSDNATLASASVSITSGFQAGQDVLVFSNNDSANYGNIAASYDAATGVLTLSSAGASATLAQWQAALRAVTYANSSEAPLGGTRTVSFTVNDGALDSTAASKSVSVSGTNDTPQVSAPATLAVTEDVASAITGISFSDADAGTNSVTVTLAVGSGSLTASSGGSVIVGGTASALTLTGSIANINAFIAASNVAFITASNATANVTLTASIDDGGNTGSGGAKSASDTVTLQVAAVNDAPTLTAPATIAVNEDVTTALTGISISDVDAGAGSVTATFSVPSGTLAAIGSSGVTVSGSGSGALTLTGSLADINAFIASSGVSFTTASNATASVVLTISVDDGGNTGSGGNRTDSTTVTLVVSAVNDAPFNGVPAAQDVDQNVSLVFHTANGNRISISDVDAGADTLEVTLTATNGLLTLSGTTGLSFSAGDGSSDSSMRFTGSLSDINNALNGLVFSPTPGYHGAASLQIITNDQGASGSGGAQTDSDTIAITVNPVNPEVVSVASSAPDGGYKVGDTLTVMVTFDQIVTVDTTGGTPSLLLETGLIDRTAGYVSGSGSNTLIFSYTVQAGDLAADLDYQSTAALALNGAIIRNTSAQDAILTLPTLGGADSIAGQSDLLIDGVAPTVNSVSVPADGTYVAGQNLDFTVNFSENVTVDSSGGTPRLAVTLDTGGTVFADYVSGSGSGALLFRLTVADGQLDSNGISLGNGIQLNGGTLKDAVGNNAVITLNGVASTTDVRVDAVLPTASIVVADSALAAGETSLVTITFSETVSGLTTADFTVANGVLSGLSSNDGGITWTATFTPTANVEDASNLITLDNSGVQDAAGNTGSGSTDSNSYAIDTLRPTATIVVDDSALAAGETSLVTITFSEAVNGLTTADFTVANGVLSGLSSNDGGITWTATLTPTANVEDASNLITLDNSGVQDAAGNTGSGSTDSNNYAIDTLRPTATIVVDDSALAAGETSLVTITFSEAVSGLTNADLSVAGGTLSAVSSADGGLTWTATFTPATNLEDASNLITLANSGVQDAAGNTGSGSTDSNNYAIDTLRPTATIVVADSALAAGETSLVTITFSEAVSGLTNADLSVAGGTLSAVSSADGGLTWTATFTPDADLEDASNLITLDLSGVQDAAGNTGSGSSDSNNYVIDTRIPQIDSVSVPADGTYVAGQHLDFSVHFSEAILVDSSGGTPRLAISLDNASVYADYLSGSGSDTLVFRLTVASGQFDSDGIAVGASLDANGGSLRDALGNDALTTLNGLAGTTGVQVDAIDPQALSLVAIDASPTAADTLNFILTFDEPVSGVDAGDFTLLTSGSVSGNVQAVIQLDARTYQVVVGDVRGEGSLGLVLDAGASGIVDGAGNALANSLSGASYTRIGNTGDPEFRVTTPAQPELRPTPDLQPAVPHVPSAPSVSPLLPPPLFEPRELGSGLPPLGEIFIHDGALAPSYIAQVFASSDAGGDGSGSGFLGFGGGDAGVFGSSTLSGIFTSMSKEAALLAAFGQRGGDIDQGLHGVFGAPSLSQQLQQIHETEQQPLRELAWALGEFAQARTPS